MQIAPDQIDPDAAKVVQRLRRYDHAAYLVGGCVRDLLLGPQAEGLRHRHQRHAQRDQAPLPQLPHHRPPLPAGAHLLRPEDHRDLHLPRQPARARGRRQRGDSGETESGDLLIRRDNVFGTPRRTRAAATSPSTACSTTSRPARSSTTSAGMADLEARVVRTIGDPDIRFREDPVRILRAMKFAARCDLAIEPETYRRMLEHRARSPSAPSRASRGDLPPAARRARPGARWSCCSRPAARRAGARARARPQRRARQTPSAALRRARFWALPGRARSLDRPAPGRRRRTRWCWHLLFPPLRDALHPDTNAVRDVGQLVARRSRQRSSGCALAPRQRAGPPDPAGDALHPPLSNPRRRPRLAGSRVLGRRPPPGRDRHRRRGAWRPSWPAGPMLAEGEPPGRPRRRRAREMLAPELQRRPRASAAAPPPRAAAAAARCARRPRRARAPAAHRPSEPAHAAPAHAPHRPAHRTPPPPPARAGCRPRLARPRHRLAATAHHASARTTTPGASWGAARLGAPAASTPSHAGEAARPLRRSA